MTKRIILLYFLVLCFNSKAQNWVPLDTGIHQGVIVSLPYGLMADNLHNNLYAFGAEYPSSYFPTNRGGFIVWNNNIRKWQQWYPYINSGSYGIEMAMFNNKVLYFYPYYENNDGSKPRTRILQFSNDTDLDTLKILQNQHWLPIRDCIYNSKLILIPFDTIPAPQFSIATFDGDTIIPIGDTALSIISSACVYNGELYCSGVMSNGKQGVAKKTINGWRKIFQIQGGAPNIGGLTVYNNRLYVYGSFSEIENTNNFGNNIVAYDGTNWDKLGGGITNTFGSAYEQVEDVAVCSGKLYVCGKFTHAGSMPSKYLLSWDDNSWCSLGNDLDSTGRIFRLECLDDTIYAVSNFKKMYGNNDFGMVSKMKNMGYSDTCTSSFVNVNEINFLNTISIYPNPTSSILNISDEQNQLQNSTIQIKNPLGQTVYSSPFINQIDISALSTGIYFLTIEDKSNKKTAKVVKD